MPKMRIVVDGDGIAEKEGIDPTKVIAAPNDGEYIITALKDGMGQGATSVSLFVPVGDGRHIFVETSLKLLVLACEAFVQAYGYPDMSEYGIMVPPGEMREKVRAMLADLPVSERRVMELRFGLTAENQPHTIDQIAQKLNTAPNNIRVIENRVLAKLRRR